MDEMNELAKRLNGMTFYEKIAYIRNGIKNALGFLPKRFYGAIVVVLKSLEDDYKKCECERNEFEKIIKENQQA